MEHTSLEDLMEKQLRPSDVDLQLKQVNEDIYSHQGGKMSNTRRKDGSLENVNNLIKSMMPLVGVADKLYLLDTTDAPAPSITAFFDQCMTSFALLSEANLEVETIRWEAFNPPPPPPPKDIFQEEVVHQKMKVIQFCMSTDPSSALVDIRLHYGV